MILQDLTPLPTPAGRPMSDMADFDKALAQAEPHADALGFSHPLYLAEQQAHSEPPTPDSLASALEKIRDCERRAEAAYAAIRADALILAADLKNRLQDPESAYEALNEAELTAAGNDQKLTKVWMTRSGIMETDERLPDHERTAIEAAEKAVEHSRDLPAALRDQAEALLYRMRPTSRPPDLPDDQGQIVIGEAVEHLKAQRFAEALNVLDSALEGAREPALRRMLLNWRVIASLEANRFDEASGCADEALQLFYRDTEADRSATSDDLERRIKEEENLCTLKALAEHGLNRTEEAWRAAERGRAGILKRDLGGIPDGLEFADIRRLLNADRAAILCVGQATRWGRLALSAGPDDSRPQGTLLQLPWQEFHRHPENRSPLDHLTELSTALIHPMEERIREITRECRVLYLVPAGDLFPIPWAGLTTGDGQPLAELRPLALTPSVAVLLRCASRRPPSCQRTLSAAGVGVDATGRYHFRRQAERVASLLWPGESALFMDEDVTAERLKMEAERNSVIFLAAHGNCDNEIADPLAASWIELAGKKPLHARALLQWKLDAELVFLNACQGALFRSVGWTQVSGFIRAFTVAGARSVVVTQERVDPGQAGELAETFFRSWLGGATKAEALCTAQLARKEAGAETRDWASYCLIGDFL